MGAVTRKEPTPAPRGEKPDPPAPPPLRLIGQSQMDLLRIIEGACRHERARGYREGIDLLRRVQGWLSISRESVETHPGGAWAAIEEIRGWTEHLIATAEEKAAGSPLRRVLSSEHDGSLRSSPDRSREGLKRYGKAGGLPDIEVAAPPPAPKISSKEKPRKGGGVGWNRRRPPPAIVPSMDDAVSRWRREALDRR